MAPDPNIAVEYEVGRLRGAIDSLEREIGRWRSSNEAAERARQEQCDRHWLVTNALEKRLDTLETTDRFATATASNARALRHWLIERAMQAMPFLYTLGLGILAWLSMSR